MSNTIPQPPTIRPVSSPLRFGLAGPSPAKGNGPIPHTAQNAVWITTERLPAKVGGLGEVSKTIPEAIAEHLPKKDVRIVVPYLQKHRLADQANPKDTFKSTGVQFQLPVPDEDEVRMAKVDVLQKFEYATGFEGKNNQYGKPMGNWVYALRCDPFFIGKNKKGEEQGLDKFTYTPKAGEFDKVMLFNRAAAQLVPLLDGHNEAAKAQGLAQFNNALKATESNQITQTPEEKAQADKVENQDPKNIDLVVAHDWLSGPVLNELEDKANTKKIFMVHNKYDKVQIPEVAEKSGLVTPERLYNREENFSALRMGIEPADAVIVNNNFERTLLNTHLADGERFVDSLRYKSEEKRTFNMHHGLSAEVTASGPQAPASLKKDGFQPLAIDAGKSLPSVAQMETFKQTNKLALQKKLGLKQDPNAIIIGWAARLEPRQKGFFLLQQSIETLMEKYKNDPGTNVQFVILGNTSDNPIKNWIEETNKKYNLKPNEAQVYIPNKFANQDEVKQLNAASDYTVLPSLYEPYGLTHLEADKMGSIPIVHGVDGLKTTVNDPEIVKKFFLGKPDIPKEAVWGMKQNGILMEPVPIDEYGDYVNRRMAFEELEGLKAKMEIDPEHRDEHFTAFLDTMKGAAENRLHLKNLAEADQREQIKRPYNVPERIQAMKDEAAAILQLRQEIEKQNDVTPALLAKVSKLMDPAENPARNINAREAQKLTTAIERAIQLKRQKKDTQIRLDALDYVNTQHNWGRLVKDYYKNVFEHSVRDDESRERHSAELKTFRDHQAEAAAPKPEPKRVYVQKRHNASADEPKGLIGTIIHYWHAFWNLNQRFWAVLSRIFSLHKD